MPSYADPNPEWARPVVAALAQGFAPELLQARFRGGPTPSSGHCYAAAESLFHALGGKAAGFVPATMQVEGGPHWFLRGPGGQVVDPTWDQFDAPPDYSRGRGCGFLTREPSARAAAMMALAGFAPGCLEGYPEAARARRPAEAGAPPVPRSGAARGAPRAV